MVDIKSFLPKREGSDDHEYFWSLVVEPGWITAGIWRIQNELAEFSVTGAPCSWQLDEELIEASDSALSSAIQGFPEDLKEPSKTVFGVTSDWVSGGEIKEEHLAKLKKLSVELSLSPIGFVVLPEAIAHLYKSEEGSPLSGVVLGIYKETVEISLFKLGTLLGTTQVARSVSLAEDVVEGLSRFAKGETLPSRFILYDGKEGDLEEGRQMLLKVNWEDYPDLKLLHTPKVEIVETKRKVYAVSLAGASELADVKKFVIDETKKDEEEILPEEKVFDTVPDEVISPEEIGFVLDEDITDRKEEPVEELPVVTKPVTALPERQYVEREEMQPQKKFIPKKPSFKLNFAPIQANLKKSLSSLGFLKYMFSPSEKKPFMFAGVLLFILLLAGGVYWWFAPKATVTLYVSPKRLEERIEVTVDTSKDSPDTGQRVLPGEVLKTQVSGEKTKDTTGTKTVGEKAKGEVTLYRVGSSLSLSSGTVINGPDDLNFVLDSVVNIASGSAGTPANTKAAVTAQDIGAQYNLASGTTFSVDNYSTSDIEAKNDSAFSGGTSREISAVSQDDQTVLQEELSDELVDRARGDLAGTLAEDKIFIEDSVTATASSKTYSNKVGDEASSLKLTLEMDAEAVAVRKEHLVQIATEVLKDRVPEGFVLRSEQIDFNYKLIDQEGGEYKFEVSVTANLLPEIDMDEISDKVRGRKVDVAREILEKEVAGLARTEIKIKPSFPDKLRTLPQIKKNIEIELAADR